MEILSIILATVAAFAAGAGYYGTLAKPWMKASGVPQDENGQPKNGSNPMLYVSGFLCQLIVAGMMRHMFTLSGIDTLGAGLIAGLGIGLFLITPWIALNTFYSMRSKMLIVIDGGYATLACAIKGLVLALL